MASDPSSSEIAPQGEPAALSITEARLGERLGALFARHGAPAERVKLTGFAQGVATLGFVRRLQLKATRSDSAQPGTASGTVVRDEGALAAETARVEAALTGADALQRLRQQLETSADRGLTGPADAGHEAEMRPLVLVKTCPACQGQGQTGCEACQRQGTLICRDCEGRALRPCHQCQSQGRESCWQCAASGRVPVPGTNTGQMQPCPLCQGMMRAPCRLCQQRGALPCTTCRDGRIACPTCHGRAEIACRPCDGAGRSSLVRALRAHLEASQGFEALEGPDTVQNLARHSVERALKLGTVEPAGWEVAEAGTGRPPVLVGHWQVQLPWAFATAAVGQRSWPVVALGRAMDLAAQPLDLTPLAAAGLKKLEEALAAKRDPRAALERVLAVPVNRAIVDARSGRGKMPREVGRTVKPAFAERLWKLTRQAIRAAAGQPVRAALWFGALGVGFGAALGSAGLGLALGPGGGDAGLALAQLLWPLAPLVLGWIAVRRVAGRIVAGLGFGTSGAAALPGWAPAGLGLAALVGGAVGLATSYARFGGLPAWETLRALLLG